MRVISKRTLRRFWEGHPRGPAAKAALEAWHAQVRDADWAQPSDVKKQYSDARVSPGREDQLSVPGRVRPLRRNPRGVRPDRCGNDMTLNIEIRPIKSEADYEGALAAVDRLMDAEPDTPEGDALDILVTLVEAYEAKRWDIGPPDPIDAIRARMEQQRLRPKDLEPFLGGSGRVSEVLNRRRPLTLNMIRRLERGLGIPARILIRESEGPPARRSAKRRRTRTHRRPARSRKV